MYTRNSCKKMQAVFEKKEIRIDFLGASATVGEGLGDGMAAYPILWKEMMKKRYSHKQFVIRNLAQSGTYASHGLFVAEEFVKGNQTDIVFLEYALNDEITPFSVEVYESLVRKLWGYAAVVIPIVLPIKNYENNGYYMVEIAKHYQLPWLDVGDKLRREIKRGTMQWEDYAKDETHPGIQGHAWIAEKLLSLFEKALSCKGVEEVNWLLPADYYFRNTYENLQIKVFEKAPSYPMELTVACSNFWVLYRKHYDDACGALQVVRDKEVLVTLYGYSMFCWDYYFPEKIWQGSKKEAQTFHFRMLPQDAKKEFVIKALGWC